jgi:hypothetical protein
MFSVVLFILNMYISTTEPKLKVTQCKCTMFRLHRDRSNVLDYVTY